MAKQKINFQTPIGVAKYPHLNKPDTAFDAEGKYKTEILLSADEAVPYIKLIEDAAKAEHGSAQYRVPYTKDPETGEVAFKLQSKFQPEFFDTAGEVVPVQKLPKIGGGSRLRLKGFLNVYKVSGSAGVSITLQGCQIVEATQGMNGSTFDAIEGGGFTIASQEANLPFEPTNADDFDF
tara:strand:- start:151 stop:687 length:537 start_codon:yes stop_codon:yes gene_type:complete